MTAPLIRYDDEDGVAVIALDRPEKRNAINKAMAAELDAAFQRFATGPARVAVLTSTAPDLFCAGADLYDPPSEAWRALPEIGFHTDKPIVAALGGKVIGLGFMLTAMCDLCVASEDTEFHFPEAKLGFSMAAVSAAATRLPLRMAMELLLLGRPVTARRAFDVGFVNDIVPPGTQRAAGIDMARALAANSPDVVGALKRLTLDVLGESPVQAHYAVRRREEAMMLGPDAQEGLRAFREKRRPDFTRS
ncbi:enoyl-CoA hydratase [Pararhodobacter marinus]|uniref:Enoyl-CoA hydratase n=1 Tax=Pararhodobacter marinus TaxID=2184063 RepID=A0A2U2C6X1_9RHOB|nr:enoyl-CoA hydratase-related protein [Pararhodobacter marinus]PWE27603.1 enoyl-CoA hydratase [Pararhodobacter marinus]